MEGRHSVSLRRCLPTPSWKVDRLLYNQKNASLPLGIIKITSHSRANQSILAALSKRFMDQNARTPLLQRRCHFDFLGFTVRKLQRKSKQWLVLLLMQICPHSGPALLSSVSSHNANCESRDSAASSPAFTTPCTRELVLFLGMDLTFDWVCFSRPSYPN